MKRSEMLDIMVEQLAKEQLNIYSSARFVCEVMLNLIEKNGMLPPSEDLNTGAWDIPIPEWDPENE